MLLIKLVTGDEHRATKMTFSADYVGLTTPDGREFNYHRSKVESIGEDVDAPVGIRVNLIEYSPDHLLLARQALRISTFMMDRLLYPDGGPHTDEFNEADLQSDAQNIARYFDRH